MTKYITILRRHNKDEQNEINVQITFVQRRGKWTGRNLKESKENAPRWNKTSKTTLTALNLTFASRFAKNTCSRERALRSSGNYPSVSYGLALATSLSYFHKYGKNSLTWKFLWTHVT